MQRRAASDRRPREAGFRVPLVSRRCWMKLGVCCEQLERRPGTLRSPGAVRSSPGDRVLTSLQLRTLSCLLRPTGDVKLLHDRETLHSKLLVFHLSMSRYAGHRRSLS